MSSTAIAAQAVYWIGLDVSSTDAAVAIPGKRVRKFPLSADGVQQLRDWIAALCPPGSRPRCVMEHSGVYSQAWAALLNALGLDCALCNPARVSQFAKADGQRSKTDSTDAQAILACARHAQPPVRVPASPARQQLAQLLGLRRALEGDLRRNRNRAHALSFLPDSAPQLALLAQQAEGLRDTLAKLEAQLATIVAQDQELAQASALLQSIPGIGPRVALQLCRILPQLRDCTPAQLSALAGLAPAHKQSGHSLRGKSRIDKQGRPELRSLLYLAALSAGRYCPQLMAVKQRLQAAGKAPKLIHCAIARRLLLLAQAVLKSGQPFIRHPAPA